MRAILKRDEWHEKEYDHVGKFMFRRVDIESKLKESYRHRVVYETSRTLGDPTNTIGESVSGKTILVRRNLCEVHIASDRMTVEIYRGLAKHLEFDTLQIRRGELYI